MRTKSITRWRKAVLGGAVAASVVLSARAQEGQPTPAAPAEQPPAAPGETQTYTIQKGDTLWDLSQKFLNNPWYWPKIWSLNPAIENPHWIYPGNSLKILAGPGGAPAQVEAQAPAVAAGEVDPNATDPNAADPNASAVDDPVAPVAGADPNATGVTDSDRTAADQVVSSGGRLSFTPPVYLIVRTGNLISEQEIAEAGTIESSFEEKEMLAQYDSAYVKFKQDTKVRVGDKVSIFRPEGEIKDPRTGQRLARRTRTLAEAKVVAISPEATTILIGRTFNEIGRGDLVRPWQESSRRLAPRANTKEVIGTIVGAVTEDITTYDQTTEVFIDKGSNDGVVEGNTFSVVRRGDGIAMDTSGKEESQTAGAAGDKAGTMQQPDESVGLLVVVEVRDTISIAVVVRSIRELAAGERVEMRPGVGSGGD
jgi:hypothetical protein